MTLIRCNLNVHFMFKYGRLGFFFNEAFVNRKLSMQSMTKSVTVYYFLSLSLKRIRASVLILNFKKKVNWVFTARKLEHDIAKITS